MEYSLNVENNIDLLDLLKNNTNKKYRLDHVYSKCVEFVKKYSFAGHDVDHAKRVYDNTIQILDWIEPLSFYRNDIEIVTIAALLHDGIDYKNPNSPTRQDFEDFITHSIGVSVKNTKIILKIIDNISYTKEIKGQLEQLEYPYNIYRDAISDADKIEAIGKIGIERCIDYTISIGGKVPEDVVKHCHEKLLKLLPGGFFKTEMGKKWALDDHQIVQKYVENH